MIHICRIFSRLHQSQAQWGQWLESPGAIGGQWWSETNVFAARHEKKNSKNRSGFQCHYVGIGFWQLCCHWYIWYDSDMMLFRNVGYYDVLIKPVLNFDSMINMLILPRIPWLTRSPAAQDVTMALPCWSWLPPAAQFTLDMCQTTRKTWEEGWFQHV